MLPLLLGLLVVLSYDAYSGAAQQEQRQRAKCNLTLRGHGRDSNRLGIAAAQLNCSSKSGPVPIAINSTHLQQHVRGFTGVRIVSNMDCATHATKGFPYPVYPLLLFCSDQQITLLDPVVQDVVSDGITSAKPYHTAVLAFGGHIRVRMIRGRFSSNAAGPAVVTLQHASLTMEGTAMDDCAGNSGVGVMTLDNSTVTIHSSTFNAMVGESGVAVLVSNKSRVVVLDSSFRNSTAKGESAGIYAQHNSSLLVHGSSFSGNLAEQGAGVCLLDNVKVCELYAGTVEVSML
jgi:hypothetical protein